MGTRVSNVIGNRQRLSDRTNIETHNKLSHKFDTDYDPINPPAMSSEKNECGADKRRAVRFWYMKTPWGYRAEIVGPFHSKLYGMCAFGRSKVSAKAQLKSRLARNFGFIGTMLLSDKDEADTVGLPDRNATDSNTSACPITLQELCGAAGQ
jgi:hypothetical protein